MLNVDATKPHIWIERGESGAIYAIHFVMPNGASGSSTGVVIDRTEANAAALEYFYEKLKGGLNI
jgi:hypothetical protein